MTMLFPLTSLPFDELRSLVLEAFKQNPETQYLTVCSRVADLAVAKNLASGTSQNGAVYGHSYQLAPTDQDRVREIIWNLVIERLVTIGMNASNAAWPFLKLTDYGREAVDSAMPAPHDPSGYIARVVAEIQDIDGILMVYLEESLKTYNIGALLSSTITLGCASERAFLLLLDSFVQFLPEERQERFKRDTEGKTIKRQFDTFRSNLEGIKGHLPGDLKDGLDTMLIGIFEMIRNNRNDAGHPTGKALSREHVYANLQVFIPYCKKIYQLKDYFTNHSL